MLPQHRLPSSLNNYAYGSFTALGPLAALGSSLKAWLSADAHGTARMTDDGSGLISSHTSEDGSALTVTAATTARPTWLSNAISSPNGNSYSGLSFDGLANCFISTTLTNIPTGATSGEIHILATGVSGAATRVAVGYGAATAGQGRRLFKITNNQLRLDDVTTSVLTDVSGVISSQPFVASGAWIGSTLSGRRNGKVCLPSSISLGTALNTNTTRLRVGANISATADSFWSGIIRHVFITTSLTQLQRMQLEAWMLWEIGWQRYCLPNYHPFRERMS